MVDKGTTTVTFFYGDGKGHQDRELQSIAIDGVTVWAAPKPHVRVHPERTFATTQRRLQFLRQDGEFDVYLYDYEAYLFPLYYPATYEEEK